MEYQAKPKKYESKVRAYRALAVHYGANGEVYKPYRDRQKEKEKEKKQRESTAQNPKRRGNDVFAHIQYMPFVSPTPKPSKGKRLKAYVIKKINKALRPSWVFLSNTLVGLWRKMKGKASAFF